MSDLVTGGIVLLVCLAALTIAGVGFYWGLQALRRAARSGRADRPEGP